MRDNYGDQIKVSNDNSDVYIEFIEHKYEQRRAVMEMTPKQARKFIKKIKRVLKQIEAP